MQRFFIRGSSNRGRLTFFSTAGMGHSYSDTLEMKEYVNKKFLEVKDV